MLIFLEAIFISVIILHQSNIWVTFLSSPSFTFIVVAVCLLAATVTNAFSVKRFHRTLVLSLFGIIATLLTQSVLAITGAGGQGRGLTSVAGYLILTVLCLIIVFRWKPRQEIFAIKVYLVVCSIMSLLGFLAWLIVAVTWTSQGQIDPVYFIDIDQFTGGKMSRLELDVERANEFDIYENTFSFPYGMGLVLTNSYLYEFLGFQFFRASGWYNEPTSIWFMVIPALVLNWNSSYFHKATRTILLTFQLCFLAVSFSVSIILSLLSIYILRKFLYSFDPRATAKAKRKIVAYVVVATAIIASLGYYAFNYVSDSSLARNILSSKISADNDYASVILGNVLSPSLGLAYWYFMIVALACCWRAAKTNRTNLMSFSLVVLCFMVVGLKGSFYHLLINPGFLIFFFLMLKHDDLTRAPRFKKITLPREAAPM